MQYSALLGALLAAPILAAAQACPSPSFNALNPPSGAESGMVEVRPANQLHMRIPAGMTHLIPSHDALAVHYGDSRRIVVLMDDGYTLKGMSDSKPGPFFANALHADKPDIVVRALVAGVDHVTFEQLISTMTPH